MKKNYPSFFYPKEGARQTCLFFKIIFTFLILSLLLPAFSFAQTVQVSGIIADSTGAGISQVTVIEKGSKKGVAANAEGKFTITVKSAQSVLQFTHLGYVSQEITVGNMTNIDVTLARDQKNEELSSVVVIGYGTQRKRDVTTAVASVKAENFVKGAVRDAGQLLQGKVAGLTISAPSGDPVASTQILLRGTATIGTSTQPLVLVDGIPSDLNTVAPEDIQSIDVLKDGSAAAIYGTRGTNGVILITTRRPSGNIEPTIEYSGYVSTQTVTRRPRMLTADEYREHISSLDRTKDFGQNTDWIDAIANKFPVTQVHTLSLRGGNAKTNYVASFNYRFFQGIFLKSDNRTAIGRVDINHNMFNDKVKINANFITNDNKYTSSGVNGDGNAISFNGAVYRQAIIRNPTSPIKDSLGHWFEQPGIYIYENPLARIYESDGRNSAQTSRLSGSVTYQPFKEFYVKALVSRSKYNLTRGYSESKQHISTIRDGRNGYASRSTTETVDNLLEITGEYNKTLGEHKIGLLGGYSYQDNTFEEYRMQNWDFPSDVFSYNNIGLGSALKNGLAPEYSYKTVSNLVGFFGRASYSYKDKYLLQANLRHEASSRFVGTKKPWGTFPSVSAGWRISQESFMQNITFLDDLKFRAGYGVTGTAPDDLFLGVSRLGYTGYFLANGRWSPSLAPISNPNPYLRWEEKRETNIGVDFSVAKGLITGSVDYYIRRTNGLLYDYPVPSPPNLFGTTRANVGKMENKGIEVMVNVTPYQTKDFVWVSSVNFSTNANKLLTLSNDLYRTTNNFFNTGVTGEPIQTYTHRVQVGNPIGDFYGFKVIDISDDGKWIYEGADGKPVAYDKYNHSQADKKYLGNGLPKYYAGWNNTFRYKNVDLAITMRGAFGYQILNYQRMYYENPGILSYNQLKSAYDKIYGKAVLNKNVPLEYNSYYIEDGDFWKVDNITLGYNINTTKMPYFKNARVYGSLLNTLVITGYKGIDPEVNRTGLFPGDDDRDKYPSTRVYTIGVNFTFK